MTRVNKKCTRFQKGGIIDLLGEERERGGEREKPLLLLFELAQVGMDLRKSYLEEDALNDISSYFIQRMSSNKETNLLQHKLLLLFCFSLFFIHK